MRISREAVALRLMPLELALAVAVATWLAHPTLGTAAGAIVAGVAGLVAVPWPDGLASIVTLVALAAQFGVATVHTSGVLLLPLVAVEAAVLWLLHLLFGLAELTSPAAKVDGALARQTAARAAAALAVAIPLVLVVLLVAASTPVSDAIRALGVIGAVVASLLPVFAFRM